MPRTRGSCFINKAIWSNFNNKKESQKWQQVNIKPLGDRVSSWRSVENKPTK